MKNNVTEEAFLIHGEAGESVKSFEEKIGSKLST
jgi:hypothetical protein